MIATAKIVTAFTVGHSVTLAIGAVHGAWLSSALVESLIGVSTLVSAVHALRPLLPGREAVLAGGFGLVHGLAFATTLASFGVDGASLAIGVLGFNLGVEAMQLMVLVATVPWRLLLARHRIYRGLRVGAGALAAVVALAWILERTSVLVTPLPGYVERAAAGAPLQLLGLAGLAIGLELPGFLRSRLAGAHR